MESPAERHALRQYHCLFGSQTLKVARGIFQRRKYHDLSKPSLGARSTVTLRQATYGFVLVGLFISSIGAVTFARVQRTAYQNAALDLAVRVRLQGAAADLSRSLAEDWERLATLHKETSTRDALDAGLRGAFASDRKVGWAGLIGEDGRSLYSNDGSKRDLEQQPWLVAAQNAPFVGVVRDEIKQETAVTMARSFLIGSDAGTIVVVMPFAALSDYLNVSGEALGMDLFLVGPNSADLAPEFGESDTFNLPSLRSAAAGIATSQRETWPDGKFYYSSVLALDISGMMPPTGLRLIGRIDPAEFAAADSALLKDSIRLIFVLLASLTALTFVFVRTFVAPFNAMAQNAKRIADGYDEYPYEGRQTKELEVLSAAIARLKPSRSDRAQD